MRAEESQEVDGEGRGDADLYADVGSRLMELYRQRINGHSKTGDEAEQAQHLEQVERRLRLAAVRAERDEIYRLGRARKLSDDLVRKLVREADLMEARYASPG